MHAMMALLGAFTLGVVIDIALLRTGDCSMGALAKAIFWGFPIGGVVGILIYKVFSRHFRKIDILGMVLGLLLSSAATVVGLVSMDILGFLVGITFALLVSCACALLGYWVVDRVAARLRKSDRK